MKVKKTKAEMKSRKSPKKNERGETAKQELERLRAEWHKNFYLRNFYEQLMNDFRKIVKDEMADFMDDIQSELRFL